MKKIAFIHIVESTKEEFNKKLDLHLNAVNTEKYEIHDIKYSSSIYGDGIERINEDGETEEYEEYLFSALIFIKPIDD